ncbi:uncharacterized protein LOC132696057 [Cylas formicarius]|uniref:uncharacterized protein LOC132696057 n=1 Tax=Cylas formicarius TaxID=197179 RepID=UPI0029585156|nr:uncharacterized protein LOC132696057 [Cylas formicarius]
MPRKPAIAELQEAEVASPLRRSTRNASASHTESSETPAKITRSRRISAAQENEDKVDSKPASRTRQELLAQLTEENKASTPRRSRRPSTSSEPTEEPNQSEKPRSLRPRRGSATEKPEEETKTPVTGVVRSRRSSANDSVQIVPTTPARSTRRRNSETFESAEESVTKRTATSGPKNSESKEDGKSARGRRRSFDAKGEPENVVTKTLGRPRRRVSVSKEPESEIVEPSVSEFDLSVINEISDDVNGAEVKIHTREVVTTSGDKRNTSPGAKRHLSPGAGESEFRKSPRLIEISISHSTSPRRSPRVAASPKNTTSPNMVTVDRAVTPETLSIHSIGDAERDVDHNKAEVGAKSNGDATAPNLKYYEEKEKKILHHSKSEIAPELNGDATASEGSKEDGKKILHHNKSEVAAESNGNDRPQNLKHYEDGVEILHHSQSKVAAKLNDDATAPEGYKEDREKILDLNKSEVTAELNDDAIAPNLKGYAEHGKIIHHSKPELAAELNGDATAAEGYREDRETSLDFNRSEVATESNGDATRPNLKGYDEGMENFLDHKSEVPEESNGHATAPNFKVNENGEKLIGCTLEITAELNSDATAPNLKDYEDTEKILDHMPEIAAESNGDAASSNLKGNEEDREKFLDHKSEITAKSNGDVKEGDEEDLKDSGRSNKENIPVDEPMEVDDESYVLTGGDGKNTEMENLIPSTDDKLGVPSNVMKAKLLTIRLSSVTGVDVTIEDEESGTPVQRAPSPGFHQLLAAPRKSKSPVHSLPTSPRFCLFEEFRKNEDQKKVCSTLMQEAGKKESAAGREAVSSRSESLSFPAEVTHYEFKISSDEEDSKPTEIENQLNKLTDRATCGFALASVKGSDNMKATQLPSNGGKADNERVAIEDNLEKSFGQLQKNTFVKLSNTPFENRKTSNSMEMVQKFGLTAIEKSEELKNSEGNIEERVKSMIGSALDRESSVSTESQAAETPKDVETIPTRLVEEDSDNTEFVIEEIDDEEPMERQDKEEIKSGHIAIDEPEEPSNSEEDNVEKIETDNNEESERSGSDFLDNMAEEGEESTPSEDSNEIIDVGESVGSSVSQYSEGDYENDSFICDDDDIESLSGKEFDLQECAEAVKEEKQSKEKLRSRIIMVSNSSDEDTHEEQVFKVENQNEELPNLKNVSTSKRRSLSIQESLVLDGSNEQLTERINTLVDTFCTSIGKGEISLNLSLEYETMTGNSAGEKNEKTSREVHKTRKASLSLDEIDQLESPVKKKRRLSRSLEILGEGVPRHKVKKSKKTRRKHESEREDLRAGFNIINHLVSDVKKRPRRTIRPTVANTDANSSWVATKATNVKPSTSLVSKKTKLEMTSLKFHPKDFKNKILADDNRVKRVETKTLLKSRGIFY